SMAHSLELRVPFLDKEVFDVAATVPVELKLPPKSVETKYALRRALDGVVPPAIVNRKKLGFPTPTRVWLRSAMDGWAHDVRARSRPRGATVPWRRRAAPARRRSARRRSATPGRSGPGAARRRTSGPRPRRAPAPRPSPRTPGAAGPLRSPAIRAGTRRRTSA